MVERAIGVVDDLGREPRVTEHATIASGVDSLRTRLVRFEDEIDRKGAAMAIAIEIDRLSETLRGAAHRLSPALRERTEQLGLDAQLFLKDLAPSLEIPSKPLFGVLPVARVISQDVHSVLDYSSGLVAFGSAASARGSRAQAAGLALGAAVVGISAITDYRLSLLNIVPIEVHEVADYLWGASAIAAPFALGYIKKSPFASALQIAAGATSILVALFTDYRAAKGRGRSKVASAAEMGSRIQPGVSSHADFGR
jgi:hypothetical protein